MHVVLVLAALLAALLPAPAQAAGRVLQVGAGGAYARLADALAVAPDGTTIELLPGFYQGTWTIQRSVALRGRHGAVLDGAGRGTLLMITAPGVTITGLTLQNTGRSPGDAAILVMGDDARIEGNLLHDCHHAVLVTRAARTVIRNNTIIGRNALHPADRGDGIHLRAALGALVELNTVMHVRDGLAAGGMPRGVVRGNLFATLRYGINAVRAGESLFEHNVVTQAETGALLQESPGVTLRHNRFAESRSAQAYGLWLHASDHAQVTGNLLAHTGRALYVRASSAGRFHQNRFQGNEVAVFCAAGAAGNDFEANDFIANQRLVLMDATSAASWRGNYWDRYAGMDRDGDGQGDTPFVTGTALAMIQHTRPTGQRADGAEARGTLPALVPREVYDPVPAVAPVARAAGTAAGFDAGPAGAPSGAWLVFPGMLCGLALRARRRGRGTAPPGARPTPRAIRLTVIPRMRRGITTRTQH